MCESQPLREEAELNFRFFSNDMNSNRCGKLNRVANEMSLSLVPADGKLPCIHVKRTGTTTSAFAFVETGSVLRSNRRERLVCNAGTLPTRESLQPAYSRLIAAAHATALESATFGCCVMEQV